MAIGACLLRQRDGVVARAPFRRPQDVVLMRKTKAGVSRGQPHLHSSNPWHLRGDRRQLECNRRRLEGNRRRLETKCY